MKIKFNWGTGIVVAMMVMVTGILVLVSVAVRQDFDLVDADYYQKSVNYQQHIEKVKNTETLEEKIRIELSADSLKLQFPNLTNYEEYSGKIQFYSPVEKSRDLTFDVQPKSDYTQSVSLKNLEKGRYQVKIDWQANNVSYYQEEDVTVAR